MVTTKEVSNKLEWRINVPDGTSETLVPISGPIQRVWLWSKGLLAAFVLKIWNFLVKAWNIGVSEPSKAIHGLKVGLTLSIVSLFYYMRPLYEGVGGNAMWAIMTVVVVSEYTVGATLSKGLNRTAGTFVAGSLGVGVHWIASQSGHKLEPIIQGIAVFLFASAGTFSRFMPSVKARFEYGTMIFILTFSFVSISGYRVENLFSTALQRLSTIVIGVSLCIIISMVFCPVWAGDELHNLICRNLEKLADSLDGSVAEYFSNDSDEDSSKKIEGYKCVLNSKAAEDSLDGFARWEPAHGRFNFRHPWKQYLKVGASLRGCAYCIETLNACIDSEIQASQYLKESISNTCITLSSSASSVLKELAFTMKTMRKSSKKDLSIEEMQCAVQELQNALNSLPNHLTANPTFTANSDPQKTIIPPLLEILPLTTLVSLLIRTAVKVEEIVDEVNELATLLQNSSLQEVKRTTKTNWATSELQVTEIINS